MSWVTKFLATDQKFLDCVARVWQQAIAHLPPSSCEDTITMALIDGFSRDVEARSGFYCEYQFHPFVRSFRGLLIGASRVDLAVIVGHDRTTYLACECKRLNVTGADGVRRSQADAYVGEDGMVRFVTENYAEDLPGGCLVGGRVACMIGYVMDGDMSFALLRIKAAMMAEPALGLQGEFEENITLHHRDGQWMAIRHALLPFVRANP